MIFVEGDFALFEIEVVNEDWVDLEKRFRLCVRANDDGTAAAYTDAWTYNYTQDRMILPEAKKDFAVS